MTCRFQFRSAFRRPEMILAYPDFIAGKIAGVESVLRSYPLCTNARVIIRRGPPGSPEREIVH
jgi:hypothetical protein